MAAGRGDFQCTARMRLAAHVGQVRVSRFFGAVAFMRHRFKALLTGQVCGDIQQVTTGEQPAVTDQCRLFSVVAGQHQYAPAVADLQCRRQDAVHRPELAGQRKLADEFVVFEITGNQLPRRGEDAERDRQVEAPAFLGQVGRREVDGDAPCREIEAGIEEGAADAVLAFPDRRLGQADDGQ